jgi:hypothetical protein
MEGIEGKMNIGSRKFIVVAAIILVVVTVAVSIAVLEWWMEASYVEPPPFTEQVNITSMIFDVTNKRIVITANNILSTSVTINEVWVNNVTQTSVSPTLPSTITAKSGVVYTITLSSLSSGQQYQVRLISIKGNAFMYIATAPS